jgi:hypothetical protein
LVYALDALGHICALRGDAEGFRSRSARCDALGWETGPTSAKAEILYYRGLSHLALGDFESGRAWMRRAVAFAEEQRFNRVLFKAEQALRTLAAAEEKSWRAEPATPAAPRELREGLRAMRQELAGSPI